MSVLAFHRRRHAKSSRALTRAQISRRARERANAGDVVFKLGPTMTPRSWHYWKAAGSTSSKRSIAARWRSRYPSSSDFSCCTIRIGCDTRNFPKPVAVRCEFAVPWCPRYGLTLTSPATTTGSGWADALAALTIEDLVMQIASVSAGAALMGRGLKLNFNHFASIRVPGRLVDATDAGAWTPEASPVLVRPQRITSGPTLLPHKLICITSYSAEMIRQSNIEAVSRALLTESMALALDVAIFSTSPSGNAPAGILYNVTPLGAATGGGVGAMVTDLGNLMKALVAAHGGADPVLVMNPQQVTTLNLTASPRFDIPILQSTSVAPGTVPPQEN